MKATTTARSQRRWLSFSLRALLVLIAIVAVWLGIVTNRARRQAEAVAAITARRGIVRFDEENAHGVAAGGGRLHSNRKPHGPVWLRRLVGDEYFREVVFISCSGTRPKVLPRVLQADAQTDLPDDELVRKIGWLTGVRTLGLIWLEVSDTGLAHLNGLNRLEELYIADCPNLTDEALSALPSRPGLRQLSFANCHFTDRGLVQVAKFPRLESVSLSSDQITDEGVGQLATASGLRQLVLRGPRVAGPGLGRLSGLAQLEGLNLASDAITDKDLRRLSEIPSLRFLHLEGGRLTNEGLAHLGTINELRFLHLKPGRGQLTDQALAYVGELANLETLEIGNSEAGATQFTDEAVVVLVRNLPRLERLRLERTYLDKPLIKQLAQERPRLSVRGIR